MSGTELLSASESASVLGVSKRRVLQFAGEGRLRGRLVGGRWVFSRREVERFASVERRGGRPPGD